MESVAQRLRLAAFVSLLVIGCGPQLGEFSDGQWAIGVWYWDLGCEEYPCRGFGPGVDIATAEFRESGVVDISTVSLCTEYPDTSGTWEVGSGSSVRIEPVEHDFLRWVAGQVDWVEVTELDECRFQSESSKGYVETWRRGVVAIEPTIYRCEGNVVAVDSQADECVGRP